MRNPFASVPADRREVFPAAVKQRGRVDGFSWRFIDSPNALAAERENWNQIVDEEYDGNPFLTCEWHSAWLKYFASPASMRYIVISRHGEAAAFLPLILGRLSFHQLPFRTLTFAGEPQAPFTAPVLRRKCGREAVRFFLKNAAKELPWDLFLGFEIPREDPWLAALESEAQPCGYRLQAEPAKINWVYEGRPQSSAEYLQSCGNSVQRNIRRHEERLSQRAPLTLRVLKNEPTESDFEAYREIYRRSWKGSEVDEEFHFELIRAAARLGWLRLGFLYSAERPIALQFWLVRATRGYAVKTAYDEEFRRGAPGVLINWKMIQLLIDEERCAFFDYLKGDHQYKKDWSNLRRQRCNFVLYRPNSAGMFALGLDRLVLPLVRRSTALSKIKTQLFHWRKQSN